MSQHTAAMEFSKWCYDIDYANEVDFEPLNSRYFTNSVTFYADHFQYAVVKIQYKKAGGDVNRSGHDLVVTQVFHVIPGDLCPLPDFSYARYPTLFSVIKGFYDIGNYNVPKWDFLTDRVYGNVTLRAQYTSGWSNGATDDWSHR